MGKNKANRYMKKRADEFYAALGNKYCDRIEKLKKTIEKKETEIERTYSIINRAKDNLDGFEEGTPVLAKQILEEL